MVYVYINGNFHLPFLTLMKMWLDYGWSITMSLPNLLVYVHFLNLSSTVHIRNVLTNKNHKMLKIVNP